MRHEAAVDSLLCNRLPRGCTLCGRAPLVHAGLWVMGHLAAAFALCQTCEATKAGRAGQLDEVLRQRYAAPDV
jgi:hypothetical protein